MFNLKNFREKKIKMTKEKFAESLNIDLSELEKLESQTEDVPFKIILEISKMTGIPIEILAQDEEEADDGMHTSEGWESVEDYKKSVQANLEKLEKEDFISLNANYLKRVSDLKAFVNNGLRKPRLAFLGLSDAGKSTLINTLLGAEKMPASWTPTTSIMIHIKHINDRPSFTNKEVCLFRIGDGTDRFDINKYTDKEHFKKWYYGGGDVELLKEYGTRQGKKALDEIGTAIVFIDSPALTGCDFIDIPGFGTGDRELDDKMSEESRNYADIIFYLSKANGFMNTQQDVEFLKESLRVLRVLENEKNDLKPLNNLFIVASHANTVDYGNEESLGMIMDEGAKRMFDMLPKGIWEDKQEISKVKYTSEHLRQRMFTYCKDSRKLSQNLIDNAEELLKKLPENLIISFKEQFNVQIQELLSFIREDIKKNEHILEDKDKIKAQLEELIEQRPIMKNNNAKKREEVLEYIGDLKSESINKINEDMSKVVTQEHIIDLIERKNIKKKKADLERLSTYVSNDIDEVIRNVLKKYQELLNDKVEDYLKFFEEHILGKERFSAGSVKLGFDARKVFASSLAGLGTFAGLTAWAATMGNLGGYILVAKGVSLLSALGISIGGGVAGAASLVALIGGPLVLGVALALIVALGVSAIIPGYWQKTVAKKIVGKIEEEGLLGKIEDKVSKHWEDTKEEFMHASASLDNELDEKIETLSNKLNLEDLSKLREETERLRKIENLVSKFC